MNMGPCSSLNGVWDLAACPGVLPDGRLPDLQPLKWLPARVPRAVHYDLMEAGRLGNIYASSAAGQAAGWVSETDWGYPAGFQRVIRSF